MYIKITAGEGHGDVLYDAGDQVQSGYVAAPLQEGNSEYPDFTKAIGVAIHEIHICEFRPDQTKYEKNHGLFAFRYAWWITDGVGVVCVVTTRNIFIVGDDGKTIDRVR